jgi:hypothetical protein
VSRVRAAVPPNQKSMPEFSNAFWCARWTLWCALSSQSCPQNNRLAPLPLWSISGSFITTWCVSQEHDRHHDFHLSSKKELNPHERMMRVKMMMWIIGLWKGLASIARRISCWPRWVAVLAWGRDLWGCGLSYSRRTLFQYGITASDQAMAAWIQDALLWVLNLPPKTIKEYRQQHQNIRQAGVPKKALFSKSLETTVEFDKSASLSLSLFLSLLVLLGTWHPFLWPSG